MHVPEQHVVEASSAAAPESSHTYEPDIIDEEERAAFERIVNAFNSYRRYADVEVARWRGNYARLSNAHKALLPHFPKKFETAEQAMYCNHCFIQSMLATFSPAANADVPQHLAIHKLGDDAVVGPTSPVDVEKVRYVLKNIMRDWSADGAFERQQSYGRVVKALQSRLPVRDPDNPPLVLVPGAGLGRLCVDLAAAGYMAEGNEFSYYMLLTSSFMLNCSVQEKQFTIFPWVHGTANHLTDLDQMRGVAIPDVVPAHALPRPGLLSMAAGDFLEVYKGEASEGMYDAVVTCFFIDTAHNVIDYITVIHNVLKEGGLWINLGPLLWHWADAATFEASNDPEHDMSLELSLADIIRISEAMGFSSLHREMVMAPFLANTKSMYQTNYNCAFWTMVKRRGVPANATGTDGVAG